MAARVVIVVGGGIVGLAAAARIASARPGTRCVVLEKEASLASHQTGRNSGVIHSGIYYKPGSLKSGTCREGRAELIGYCRERGIAHELCGKVIVALDEDELPRLASIEERGRANGVACRRISPAELREREPAAAGVAALLVEDAGIVDYRAMCEALAADIRVAGGEVHAGVRVERVQVGAHEAVVHAEGGRTYRADAVINCAGLHSDRVARAAGERPSTRIVPFRGEYYRLRADAPRLCRHLIYPVPDPSFPFLGVHLTRMVEGGVECGPNAVLALGREAYTWGAFDLRDALEIAAFPGFWRLAARHWRAGMGEVRRSLHLGSFVSALQRLVPALRAEHLEPAPAGIRAQAMEPDGSLVDDFRFLRSGRCVHVINAPSPAATASLAIARRIAAEAAPLLA
jgi:L-2-hydroxyglutarate oxidase